MRVLSYLIVLLSCAACAVADAASTNGNDRDWPVYGDPLSREEIREALSGKTIRGCYRDGLTWELGFNADGSMVNGNGWYIREDKLCYRTFSSGQNDFVSDTCHFVTRDERGLHFYASRSQPRREGRVREAEYVSSTVCPIARP